MKTSILSIVVLLALICHSVKGTIKCVQCSKLLGINNPPQFDCSNPDHLPPVQSCYGAFDICLKTYTKSSAGVETWVRGCATYFNHEGSLGRNECRKDVQGGNSAEVRCSCDKDGCNAGGRFAPHVVAVVGVTAVLYSVLF